MAFTFSLPPLRLSTKTNFAQSFQVSVSLFKRFQLYSDCTVLYNTQNSTFFTQFRSFVHSLALLVCPDAASAPAKLHPNQATITPAATFRRSHWCCFCCFSRCTKFAAAADAIFLFLLGCSSRVSSRWKKKSHTHLFRTFNHRFRAVLDLIRFPDAVADVFEQFWTHQKHRKMVFGGSENCFLLASKFLRGAFSDYFSFLMQNAAESGTRFVSSDSLLLCSFRIRKTCATSR